MFYDCLGVLFNRDAPIKCHHSFIILILGCCFFMLACLFWLDRPLQENYNQIYVPISDKSVCEIKKNNNNITFQFTGFFCFIYYT